MVFWKALFSLLFVLDAVAIRPAAEVVELCVYNFASTIRSCNYTCVLFYDSLDEAGAEEYTQVLQALKEKYGHSINVARLDIRHNQYLRRLYNPSPGEEGFAKEYYDDFSSDPNNDLVLHPEMFMNMALGTLFWPVSMNLMGKDFNVYADLDLRAITANALLKTAVVERWYKQNTLSPLEDATPNIFSMANQELAEMEKNKHADNSFDFEAYEKAMEEQDENIDEEAPKTASDMRLLLETDSVDDGKVSNHGPFTYKKFAKQDSRISHSYLALFSTFLDHYFGWIEGYESSWSPERKHREDEQTNFGFYLNQMNQQLRALVDRIFDPDQHQELLKKYHVNTEDKKSALNRKTQLPNLKKYLDEMVFGYGRLPATWKETTDDMAQTLGATPEERRQNRVKFNGSEFPIIERMREYMDVFAKVHDDDDLYNIVLADLINGWYNIVQEFHTNLSNYYNEVYLPNHPRPHGNEFQFKKMDVLDMNAEESRHLLTNYNDFHKKYTEKGIPVILSNVQMTRHNITLDYLVETCAASDVTDDLKLSHKVGQRQSKYKWNMDTLFSCLLHCYKY